MFFSNISELIYNFDSSILLWIQDSVRNPILTPFFTFITHLGDSGIFWIALSLILCIFKKTRKVGICGLFALLFSVTFNNAFLKNVVGRIRPYEIIPGLECIVKHATDPSFPSGHTGASIAAATAFLKTLPKKFSIPAMVVAVLISLSRLYIGIHYPTDVIAGAITGAALGIIACVLIDFIIKKVKEKHPDTINKIFWDETKENKQKEIAKQ